MRFSTLISLAVVIITSLFLFACGGGGNGASTTTATRVTLTADKMTAVTPVLNGGTTTISFNFGLSIADGTVVTYTASPASAVLSVKTNVTGGLATVVVTSAIQANVTVTASIASATGSKIVQFIPQPDKVVVHVGLKNAITNLQTLAISLRNTGATCIYSSYTPTLGHTGFSDTLLADPTNNLYFLGILLSGFNAAPSANLLDLTFNSVATGIPYFEIFAPVTATNLSYSTYSVPNTYLATTDFAISTDYYLGAALLATK